MPIEDSDHPAHPRSLISVSNGCSLGSLESNVSSGGKLSVLTMRERSGSVVECLTQDRRAVGSSLTGVTALWSLSKTHLS